MSHSEYRCLVQSRIGVMTNSHVRQEDERMGIGSPRRGGLWVLVYIVLIVIAALTVTIVKARGDRIVAAPHAPPLLEVRGDA